MLIMVGEKEKFQGRKEDERKLGRRVVEEVPRLRRFILRLQKIDRQTARFTQKDVIARSA